MTTTARGYNTRQKAALLDCMRQLSDEAVTVERLLEYIREKGLRLGQTTVYRHLDRLAREGVLIRYAAARGESARYQYIGDPGEHCVHSHLVCLGCGHMEHVECAVVDTVNEHMQTDHHFTVDRIKTVFYGYCRDCNVPDGERPGQKAP